MDSIQQEKKLDPAQQYANSIVAEEKGVILDDPDVQQFYGSSTTEAYRLKSELVGKCMEEIGMGRCVLLFVLAFRKGLNTDECRFQWKLFVVTGFGWIVDNVRGAIRLSRIASLTREI